MDHHEWNAIKKNSRRQELQGRIPQGDRQLGRFCYEIVVFLVSYSSSCIRDVAYDTKIIFICCNFYFPIQHNDKLLRCRYKVLFRSYWGDLIIGSNARLTNLIGLVLVDYFFIGWIHGHSTIPVQTFHQISPDEFIHSTARGILRTIVGQNNLHLQLLRSWCNSMVRTSSLQFWYWLTRQRFKKKTYLVGFSLYISLFTWLDIIYKLKY